MKAIRRFTVRVTLPEPLAALYGLMLNLRWSWHRPAADLFASIDPAAWAASGGDPVAMLSALPSARIAALAADGDFLRRFRPFGGKQGIQPTAKPFLLHVFLRAGGEWGGINCNMKGREDSRSAVCLQMFRAELMHTHIYEVAIRA